MKTKGKMFPISVVCFLAGFLGVVIGAACESKAVCFTSAIIAALFAAVAFTLIIRTEDL